MKINKTCLVLMFLLPVQIYAENKIKHYTPLTAIVKLDGDNKEYLAIRKYEYNKRDYMLLLDMDSLETFIYNSIFIKIQSTDKDAIKNKFINTNYFKSLVKSMIYGNRLHNAGFKNFLSMDTGVHLTIDLCPSKKPLDRKLFIEIINNLHSEGEPVPIAIAVTGTWLRSHKNDLQWLMKLQSNFKIDITWINHSYFHRVKRKKPMNNNFLLLEGTNIHYEILETERKMLEHGIVPSLFFRFPGLVSNIKLYKKVVSYGLIPLGSDAWLSKKQKPKNGSIILIHANGLDKYGIDNFVNIMKKEKMNIKEKKWYLQYIRKSLIMSLEKS